MRFLRAGGAGGSAGPSMAEPLLRKTLSRLRGRDKLTRKKSDAQERGRPAQHPEPSPPEPEPQAPEGPQAAAERPPSPEASRSPGRGAYLQSLEPSSRRWVLSGAKPPEEAAALGAGEPAGEIWYNPIPEDDPRDPAPQPPGAQPGSEEARSLAGPPPPGPGAPLPARAKSPGPARRLSLRHKLPELRRRLSLRGPRAPRAPPAAGSVLGRYHLDSSVRAGPAAFRPYRPSPAPAPALWGRLSLHLCGLGGLRPAGARELSCLLQVDGRPRARTAPLRAPAGPGFVRLDHAFQLELEAARLLRALVLGWDPRARRHRACAQGAVLLPAVLRGNQAQLLAVRLEPQGLLYAKLALAERREAPGEARVFGLPLQELVERERSPDRVPLLIQKCVHQIERRGLRVVGLYRLCGSAAVKKELRDAFERDSEAVCLSEDLYPDINVITGILKDYLRELPTPLITPPLYQVVLEAMARGTPSRAPSSTESTRELLNCLPEVEKATLTLLLDHLRLVSSFHAHNRMTPQNLAVCFGPVLLPARQAPTRPRIRGSGPGLANADVDFKRHIEVLHYLLQAWPDPQRPEEVPEAAQPALRPQHLPLDGVVTRTRDRGGPESPPSNRYAGDWSVCGRDFLSGRDEDHVTDSEDDEDIDDDIEAPFNPHLNLSDFDALILDLERELSKQINVCL